jgi:Mlc titration factor MtfA (ptsG expression regulator)
MRIDPPQDRWQGRAFAALALLACTVLGAALGQGPGAAVGAATGVGAAAVLARAAGRRGARRREALKTPFPPEWREILATRYDHYDRLPPDLRARFEDDVRIFMAETRVTGIEMEADDELRLLVAASAVTLSLGWPAFEWDGVAEVLLYPHDFDRDYGFERAELAGQAHPWGTIILSVPALRQSFADPDDAFHVGLHEFTHLLEVEDSRVGAIPVGLDPASQRAFVTLMESEMARLRHGRSVIDDYGAHEPAEFVAVAVEAFFEVPLALRARHRELYTFLSSYFGQDPAAWDDARGLTL